MVIVLLIASIGALFFIGSVLVESDRLGKKYRRQLVNRLVSGGAPRDAVEKKIADQKYDNCVAQWEKDGCWFVDKDGYTWAYGARTGFPPMPVKETK